MLQLGIIHHDNAVRLDQAALVKKFVFEGFSISKTFPVDIFQCQP